ncbi:hypothetical protein OC25_12350 [Pedobacter kyungheensis]|uniref:Uncharacterized protein n=1 Tax=Pedobacter kyungheensis TaxID=1069985 RepID=A0A0C1G0H2_9SPHI|nr:hypothetical protein [Pedobacter kyungheensis]KIA93559.1 hypothetical protein OC25_12350 [Pedobacter kyungheensis]
MENKYAVTLSLLVPIGLHTYGSFFLGTDRREAKNIFGMLKGKTEPIQGCCIQMELCEEISGISISIAVLHCCSENLKDNIAVISREVFRISQLERGHG